MTLLHDVTVYLAAAVVAVPLSRRLGLGAVLGYLAAGLVIGPSVLGLVSDVANISHFAEFGVVMLLFVIGLELKPARLYALRRAVFGLGGAQVAVTAAGIGCVAGLTGAGAATALVIGAGLAMSSTALVLQLLQEQGDLSARHGRAAFAVLLFQDLSVIPLLALLPLLASAGTSGAIDAFGIGRALLVIAGLAVASRTVLRPLFRAVARSGQHEIFTAAALLVVTGTAVLMESVGLSMALGAFLAGVLLADSEYRHELQADLDPFKGLLLGLFFIAVGMSVSLDVLLHRPVFVLAATAGLMLVKAAVIYAIGRLARFGDADAAKLALCLAQGGEFAFVLFSLAGGLGLLTRETADLLVLVVSLSMMAAPLLVRLGGLALAALQPAPSPEAWDEPPAARNHVVIAGMGRFGQIVGRILRVRGIPFTALDKSAEQVDTVRRFGSRAYFGDASRLELLESAAIGDARHFVLAIDDVEDSVRAAAQVRRHHPQVRILARARNRRHAHRLMELGVPVVIRETLYSSLELTRVLLRELGVAAAEADRIVQTFRAHDQAQLESVQSYYENEERLVQAARAAAAELERLLEADVSAPNTAPPGAGARDG